jgi:arylsulfatase
MQEKMLSFIEENKSEPFFMYWASPIPHLPLQAPQRWVDYYHDKFGDEDPLINASYYPHRYPRAAYAAMISYLDEQVGELLTKLKELGIYENSIIIFTSDNGPTYIDADVQWFESAGILKTDSKTNKGYLNEGGIRVPMIVSWPAEIKNSFESDHISAFWDIMPTLTEIAGTMTPDNNDGISFLPELLGQKQNKHDHLYWEFSGYSGQQALRMGPWKAIRKNIKKGNLDIELYNLETDILEENNIAKQKPDLMDQIDSIFRTEHTISPIERFRFDIFGEE